MLYTKNGSYPAPLPSAITLSSGFIRTDPESFTADEIAEAGYVAAADAPAFDPETGTLGWDGEAWQVTARPPPPFPTLARKAVRNGLLSIGITSADVVTVINAIPDPLMREAAMIDWEDTKEYDRHYPLVDTLADAFGLPAEQVDTLWRWAAPSP